MEVKILLSGDKNTISNLQNLQKHLKGFSPELRKTGQFLKDFYSTVPFATEGSIYGKRWGKLDPDYAKRKQELYPGRGILEASGTLRRSFNFMNTDNFLKVFNTSKYYPFHQKGTSNMSQRLVMAINRKITQAVVKIVKSSILKRIR